MKTILLKFAGPLQSWGTDSHFESRFTDFHPSKSAVIGLIAASLGINREDDEKLRQLDVLSFATRVDQKGSLLQDYHIAQKYKKNGDFERNYVTNRYYLEDSVSIVAIGCEDDELMGKIDKALKNPYYAYFMGRRSCPVSAGFYIKITDEDVISSITKLEWQAAKWYKKTLRHKDVINLNGYCDYNLMENKNIKQRRDNVNSFSQKNRKFDYRFENRFNIKIKNDEYVAQSISTEHDVFMEIGGEDVSI